MSSDMTYNVMLRRLAIPAVPHGFRVPSPTGQKSR